MNSGGHELAVVVKLQHRSLENQKRLEAKMTRVETALNTGLSDLRKLIEEKEKKCFTVKDSGYEVAVHNQLL